MEQFYAIRESARRLMAEEGERTSPDSWRGRERDPAWAEMDRKREQLRGRG